jgi:hypothetical protein
MHRSCISPLRDAPSARSNGHAATPWRRIELGTCFWYPEGLEESGHELDVHGAYQITVLLGDSAKRAVAERDNTVFEMRLVPMGGKHPGQAFEKLPTRKAPPDLCLSSDGTPVVVRHRGEGLGGSQVVIAGIEQCLGEERCHDVVVALGDAEGDLLRGAAIELGGPAGPGAASPRRTAVLDLEQTQLGQLVEVESRHRPGHAHRSRCRLPADRGPLGSHVQVQPAPQGLGQGGQGGKFVISVVHSPILKHIHLDGINGEF